MKKIIPYIIILFSVTLIVSCGGRVPTAKTAQSVSTKYFRAYGNKYPSTEFGQKNVERVMINAIEEVSYRFALVDANIHFVNGHQSRVLVKMEKKFPGGWKTVSWETLEYR